MRAVVIASLAVLVAAVVCGAATGSAQGPEPKPRPEPKPKPEPGPKPDPGPKPEPGPKEPKTGLHGVVTQSLNVPRCDLPCVGPAPDMHLTFVRFKTVAGETTTSADGAYRIRLEPGAYSIHIDRTDLLVRPGSVTVPEHGVLRLDIFLAIGAITNGDVPAEKPKPEPRPGHRPKQGHGPSGLYGVATKGPLRPVCQIELECYGPAAGLPLLFLRDGEVAAQAITGDDGTYRIRLRPGVYSVTIRGLRRPPPIPSTVTVPRHGFAQRNFFIDTGIR